MWKLRVLKGADIKEYSLKEGVNSIGRSTDNDVVILSNGVSKKHAQIIVREGVCSITDLNSSNGTFVNGARVQDRILKNSDRIAFHTTVVELEKIKSATQTSIPQFNQFNPLGQAPQFSQQNTNAAHAYLENVVLPGIYKLNQLYPLKSVLLIFVLAFAVVLTVLSTIPMSSMMKDGVEKEAQRRALTIARQLAAAGEQAYRQGAENTVRTDFAETEDGVTAAMVVSKEDGHIIAPLLRAQSYSNEEFVARARKHDEIFVDKAGSSIGASYPIRVFSTETGQQSIAAYAVVLYKINSVNLAHSVGLFARILIIALLVGWLVYFLIYKIVSKNVESITTQLDSALRGEKLIIEPEYDFEQMHSLITNINSALSRMGQKNQSVQIEQYDPLIEAMNLTRIIQEPAIILDKEKRIISVNTAFEDLTGMRLITIQNQSLDILQDQALKLNLEDLWLRSMSQPSQISSSQLDISGTEYEIDAQSVTNGERVNYTVIVIKRRMAA
ncbi:MAG: FHA domain-containing protein [Oligoflexia bacterium]|nr:FHA domain-containing protein [Oligoflexia bacterium]